MLPCISFAQYTVQSIERTNDEFHSGELLAGNYIHKHFATI